jgi:hypothetical protein
MAKATGGQSRSVRHHTSTALATTTATAAAMVAVFDVGDDDDASAVGRSSFHQERQLKVTA